jgi:4-diphosphocytidyl-2-C-methyl-D-erythritol kinase
MVNKTLMEKTLFAPAKLNLNLRVTGRRADGYHILETLIAPTDLGDTLTLKAADSLSLRVDGPFADHAPADESNLVMRAIRLMEDACGRKADIEVRLTKSIPAGAGMGGGSADAAAIMRALNAMWSSPLSEDALKTLGLKIGAELPACLSSGAQWVSGIGEDVKPVYVPTLYAIVIWPGVKLATKDVFAAYKGPFSKPLEGDASAMLGNDLTSAAATLAPVINVALSVLPGARMTGSGSAVFSVCDDLPVAKETAAQLAAAYPDWWVRSCTVNP